MIAAPFAADGLAPVPPLPTAELHIHLEGTLEADMLVRLARRNEISLPTYDARELTERYVFGQLQDFLDVHYANLAVLRTEADFYDLASAYLAAARAAGVVHAEPFVDINVHRARGVAIEPILEGYGAAFREARADGFSCSMILSFTRDLGAQAAQQLLSEAMPYREEFVGVGLASTEVGYPPSLFRDVYAAAAAEGLRRVAHAGEEGGPDYVREALDDLGVERIDHGLRAMEDPDLVARLAAEQVALTVCPLSNVALHAVPSMAEHPVRRMLDEGLRVTVNSDDPAYFGGQVDANYAALADVGLDEGQLRTLARNSFDAAFVDDARRQAWKADVDAWGSRPGA